MKIFKYKEDRLPIAIFAFYTLLDFYVYLRAESVIFLVVWCLLGILPKVCISAWNHHHQHVNTFHQNILNRLLEIMYSFHTGVSCHGWMLHHNLGHHLNYLDQTLDEARWRRKDGSQMGVIEYSIITTLTSYPRAISVARRFPKYIPMFIAGNAILYISLAFMLYHNWVNTLFIYLIPIAYTFYNTIWHTYYHHAGLETEHHMHASYSIKHRLYNICFGNLGYHTAHHYKMGVHWSKLPDLHAKIEKEIPNHLYREPPIPFKWFKEKNATNA